MANQLVLKTCDTDPVHTVLLCVTKFKGLEVIHHHLQHEPPAFIDDGNTILGFHNIIAHIEERFPAPPLLIGDPISRSRQRMVFSQLIDNTQHYGAVHALREFEPFVAAALKSGSYLTGDLPTIVDVAVAALCTNEPSPFAEFRNIMQGFCTRQLEVA